MTAQMQNPAVGGRVSRDQLGSRSHILLTASARQAQMLSCRFCLSPWTARDIAWLCFGEGCDE